MKKGQISIDFTGKVIDYLSVVKWHSKGNHKGDTNWLCHCICGEFCLRTRSFLSGKRKDKKTCGNCVDGQKIIGETFNTFKILHLEKKHRRSSVGFFIGECLKCGSKKKISKATIKSQTRKRNFTCYQCLIMSRRGGGLEIGNQNGVLRILSPAGCRGEGAKRKFYWLVECLYQGPDCKNSFECSSTDFQNRVSCGCKAIVDRKTVNGLASRKHSMHKIYTLRKQINDRCHKAKHINYPKYGGRGIYVCDDWRAAKGKKGRQNLFNFVNWCLSNGWSEGLQLDRIDNDGPYSPSNCQFIPSIENLFYSAIDNADHKALKTYIRYWEIWNMALVELKKKNESVPQEYESMINRWNDRVKRRASILGTIF